MPNPIITELRQTTGITGTNIQLTFIATPFANATVAQDLAYLDALDAITKAHTLADFICMALPLLSPEEIKIVLATAARHRLAP